jgi:nickel/cobalt exporter
VHGDDHAHHHHHGETRRIDTGHGVLALDVFEDGVPPRWRLRALSGDAWLAGAVTLDTLRPDGTNQLFTFVDRGGYLESSDEIPEPHAFKVRLNLGHGDHTHGYELEFSEDGHSHGIDVGHSAEDAHAIAHAAEIRQRFASRNVTTLQIVMFGLTGGLIPCPAAITVLLLCLQLKQFTLGVALVLCFSIGLALTMVSAGVIAALSVQHVGKRWSGFGALAARAPYLSSALIVCVGLYVGWQGLAALMAA